MQRVVRKKELLKILSGGQELAADDETLERIAIHWTKGKPSTVP